MKTRLPFILAMSIAVLTPATAAADAALAEPARAVDLARYAGTWYEIARKPHFFQRNCARNVTATYVRKDDHVQVVNACEKDDGEQISVEGKAFVLDANSNRKLEVGFFELFGWMPFKGDYWVLDFDPEYRWVIVGGPDLEYGWILARTPALTPDTRADIDARLQKLGYDVKEFANTEQKPKAP